MIMQLPLLIDINNDSKNNNKTSTADRNNDENSNIKNYNLFTKAKTQHKISSSDWSTDTGLNILPKRTRGFA